MKIYIKFSQLSNEEFSKHDQRFKKKTQRRNKAFLWQPQTHKHANTCPQSNLKTPKKSDRQNISMCQYSSPKDHQEHT